MKIDFEATKELRIVDSFTPSNWKYLNSRDLDFGSSGPVVFPFHGRTLVATIAKEAVLYLLDANALGGPDHSTPLYQSALAGGAGGFDGALGVQLGDGGRCSGPGWSPRRSRYL